LENSVATSPASLLTLTSRIVLAFILGGAVAALYHRTHRSQPYAPTFPRTLVLLSILIAMVTQVIGDNVARAFSLVGALSIVRFRTIVQDTQDTAFVIFAVIVGMAAGADHLWVAIVGLVVVGIAIMVLRPRDKPSFLSSEDGELVLRVAIGTHPDAIARDLLARFLQKAEISSVTTAKQGSALEVAYRVRLRPGTMAVDMVQELNRTEGIQGVELRRITD
jgi:uncharacterized membrane protein YhiD involved in acid resistance